MASSKPRTSKPRTSAKPKTQRRGAAPAPTVREQAPRRTRRASVAGKQDPDPAEQASEQASEQAPDSRLWTLRLYVAGDSPKSRSAIANLERLCEAHLKGKYKIEVIDLKTRPELAKADQILALPTLVRKIPEPMKRLIGDLSNAERALLALELGEQVHLAAQGTKHAEHVD